MKCLDPVVVVLKNGDIVHCDYKSVSGNMLVVYHEHRMTSFLLSEIESVYEEQEYAEMNKPAPVVPKPQKAASEPQEK